MRNGSPVIVSCLRLGPRGLQQWASLALPHAADSVRTAPPSTLRPGLWSWAPNSRLSSGRPGFPDVCRGRRRFCLTSRMLSLGLLARLACASLLWGSKALLLTPCTALHEPVGPGNSVPALSQL